MYVRSDGLAGVVIADNEYPPRVCFTLLDKVSVGLMGLCWGPPSSSNQLISKGISELSPKPPEL